MRKALCIAVACVAFPLVQADESGWYAGVSLGNSDNKDFVESNSDGSLSGLRSDESDLSYQVHGGYEFNEHVAAEASYVDMGEPSFTATSDGSGDSWEAGAVGTMYEADGWMASVIGKWPIGPRWTLFGRLGLFSWSTTETFTEPSGVSVDKNSGSDAVYGAGAEYDPGEEDKFVWRAEYSSTQVDMQGDTVDTLSAGLTYKFD